MISADREGLKAYMNKMAMEVLEKEIELFTHNISMLSKLATLTMVIAWQFFMMPFERDPECHVRADGHTKCTGDWNESAHRLTSVLVFFYGSAALSFGFNAVVVAIASWCMVYGPSLAVRGPEGSMQRSIEGLYDERTVCFFLFFCGQVCMMQSGVVLVWSKFDARTALYVTVAFCCFAASVLLQIKWRVRAGVCVPSRKTAAAPASNSRTELLLTPALSPRPRRQTRPAFALDAHDADAEDAHTHTRADLWALNPLDGGRTGPPSVGVIANCPNRANPYHTCSDYCLRTYGEAPAAAAGAAQQPGSDSGKPRARISRRMSGSWLNLGGQRFARPGETPRSPSDDRLERQLAVIMGSDQSAVLDI